MRRPRAPALPLLVLAGLMGAPLVPPAAQTVLPTQGAAPPPSASEAAASAAMDPDFEEFLRRRMRLATTQITTINRGEPVTLDAPPTVDREIAVAGVVHIAAPAERLVALVEDIERLESGEGFLATKRISEPPALEDFAALSLPAEDVAALAKCRPGRCDVKLGQGAFDRLHEIDWKGRDVAAQVNALARQMALDYVRAYRAGGNGELAIYLDSSRPQFVADEFVSLTRRLQDLPDPTSALADYLVGYPKAERSPGLEEFFYWSLADFGLKPVVRLNHVVIQPASAGRTRFVIATKQLYASHYFQTALELRALVDDAQAPGRAHYLVVFNVARSDGFTGLFGGVVKGKVRDASRKGLAKALAATKSRCERS
jgi:hypothetical protein